MAVNSGNSPAQVSQYVRKHRIPWPVIADTDRSLEQACGVGDISLNNIWQARIIDPEGLLVRANGSQMEETAQRAARDARWNVDPSTIPAELQPAWQQIEFGSFAPAASTLKRYARSRKADVKTAAQTLQSYVDEQLQQQVDAAAAAVEAEDVWTAYGILTALQQRFKGYEIPDSVPTDVERLAKDERVTKELAAARKLELALKSATSSSATARKRAELMLQKVVDEFPGTQAAEKAASLLSPR